MRRFWWLRVPAFLAAVATLSVHAETFSLVGVTLADGGTITGQFDWNDVAGSFAFTNVDITVTGAGAELGMNTVITAPDPLNTAGLCFVEPPVSAGACTSSSRPSLIFIFDQRMTPNVLSPTTPALSSDGICVGNTSCFGTDESEFNFSNGDSVAITAGSVVATPEPSTGSTAILGAFALTAVALGRRYTRAR